MPLPRYPVYIEVFEDFGRNDNLTSVALANDGTLWQAVNMKPGDPSTVWSQLPDLPQP